MPARIVDDHRALRVLDVWDVDRLDVDTAPVQAAEALAGEDVQRARENHEIGLRVAHVLLEVVERHVDARPEVSLRRRAGRRSGRYSRWAPLASPGRGPGTDTGRCPSALRRAGSPLRRQASAPACPTASRCRADVALVEDRAHQLEAPLLEVRRLRARGCVDAAALLQLGLDLLASRLLLDVRQQDRPVEDLVLYHDVDAVPVGRNRVI